jgi:hypothetical protein
MVSTGTKIDLGKQEPNPLPKGSLLSQALSEIQDE